jgi:hypothetical protein
MPKELGPEAERKFFHAYTQELGKDKMPQFMDKDQYAEYDYCGQDA